MARAERWEIASDAELVKRGRILTIFGVIILCLGSLVTVALMSVTGTSGPQRTGSGPIRLVAPQVASHSNSGSTGGAASGGSAGEATPGGATTGGASGAELPGGTTTGAGTGTGVTGPSNLDPSLVPAPGTNILGLPVLGATPSSTPTPPSNTGQLFDL
ncbi:hypothetical protein DYH09_05330 [bacterium CPR1]|nr:hypothetical protein [bacterium CPR1]